MKALSGLTPDNPLQVVIVGGGFGGIGMAIELKKRFFKYFLVLEKGDDVGGVWRDNTYPGAACDVPSHLYSFSFEPNPNWSHAFSPQAEILDYLRHCADKYNVRKHFRFGTEVQSAHFDARKDLWEIKLTDGTSLWSKVFITAMGQLSRPSTPSIPGLSKFRGKSFHSARWDHSDELFGKKVAVVGTGASAIQFVPAIAPQVSQLKVFQRSPSYIIPRPDRPYSEREKAMNRRFPLWMKLRRLGIYLQYESRALAFTRFKGLLAHAVGKPFKAMLNRQVKDHALRKQLTPDYQIGCKRILLSSDYYKAITRSNAQLVTQKIVKAYEYGLETEDGRRHEVDTIIFGTGFAATEFLSPLTITGLNNQNLNTAWQQGAKAYLGMTVPNFPNFFMLYGPNTNLGHNSIVYMLESQIQYISRALRRMRSRHATRLEVNEQLYTRHNQSIQQALSKTVWNGCDSWYVDENGHNSTGWPGFTLTYRWLTQFSRLHEFSMTGHAHTDVSSKVHANVFKTGDPVDGALATLLRGFLRVAFKPFIGKPFGIRTQRVVVALLAPTMLGRRGVLAYNTRLGSVPARVTAPKNGERKGAILFLHGGAFCVGSPWTHRSMTSRLAFESGLPVYALDYRLAPEHPYPACLEDAVNGYKSLLRLGYKPEHIVVSGDSAGGS
ncbi:MAG: alpha/beta hydrolase fold domain-containing protein, partial [Limnobacter sp.]|nr:alpha/beta hydrolase fold domain-containing protein [Limnobacter sp.]